MTANEVRIRLDAARRLLAGVDRAHPMARPLCSGVHRAIAEVRQEAEAWPELAAYAEELADFARMVLTEGAEQR
jgi:hypothetical protein